MIPCRWCNIPEHSEQAYSALMGWHDYEPDDVPEVADVPTQEPRITRCDDGPGVTMTWEQVNEQPSDRLPRWPDPPPEPNYRTGRVGPLPPVPEESYPPDAVDLPVQYERPSMIRRIRNAARRSN